MNTIVAETNCAVVSAPLFKWMGACLTVLASDDLDPFITVAPHPIRGAVLVAAGRTIAVVAHDQGASLCGKTTRWHSSIAHPIEDEQYLDLQLDRIVLRTGPQARAFDAANFNRTSWGYIPTKASEEPLSLIGRMAASGEWAAPSIRFGQLDLIRRCVQAHPTRPHRSPDDNVLVFHANREFGLTVATVPGLPGIAFGLADTERRSSSVEWLNQVARDQQY
jgi:hypothetical protein